MEFEKLNTILEIVLSKLIKEDLFLLENDVSERSISHKLGCYLPEHFPGYDVDCEYNRNVQADTGKKYIKILRKMAAEFGYLNNNAQDGEYVYRNVFPDIIVHKRGKNDNNLLIIEMKKSSSIMSPDYDYEKLRRYTSPIYENELNYTFGIFIYVGVEKQAREIIIEWFQNGEQISKSIMKY